MLFNNNANVLVVNEQTAAASEKEGKFLLQCVYRRPIIEQGTLLSGWESRLVSWNSLTRDFDNQRVFSYDTEAEERCMRQEIQVRKNQALRDDLFAALLDHNNPDWRKKETEWSELSQRFGEFGLSLCEYHNATQLRSIVFALLSAKEGVPVGYQYKKLIEISHHLAEHFPAALIAFGHALRIHGHFDTMKNQDISGKWDARAAKIRHEFKAGTIPLLDSRLKKVVAFLFPDLSQKLEAKVTTTRSDPNANL